MASQSFGKFVTQVKNKSVAKSSHFYVELAVPEFMGGSFGQEDLKSISLYVEQTQFPEIAFATTTAKVDGLNTEMIYDKLYGQSTMTFVCDRDMSIKRFFDTWASGIITDRGGIFRYYKEYVVPKITIYQLDEQKNVTYACDLIDVYPKVVNDILPSSSSKDYNRFQVQFQYRYWESRNLKSLTGPGIIGNSTVVDFARRLDSGSSSGLIPGQNQTQKVLDLNREKITSVEDRSKAVFDSVLRVDKNAESVFNTAKSFAKDAYKKLFGD